MDGPYRCNTDRDCDRMFNCPDLARSGAQLLERSYPLILFQYLQQHCVSFRS